VANANARFQRRHQKLIEESPSPALDPAQREAMEARRGARVVHIGYRNAGTFEFLVAPDGSFSFIELKRAPAGRASGHRARHLARHRFVPDPRCRRRAARARRARLARWPRDRGAINAEDPSRLSSVTRAVDAVPPTARTGVRVDTFVEEGSVIPPYYDSLIAKLVVRDNSRHLAIERALQALREFEIGGVPTTRDVLYEILGSDDSEAATTRRRSSTMPARSCRHWRAREDARTRRQGDRCRSHADRRAGRRGGRGSASQAAAAPPGRGDRRR